MGLGLLAGGLGAFLAGVALLWDDLEDLGEFDTEDHPSPLHHWQYSLPLMAGGIAAMGAGLIHIMSRISSTST